MQVSATDTSPVVAGTGASAYTDIVTSYVNTLASGSAASLDDKLAAYQSLEKLMFTSDKNNDGSILYKTNKNDWRRALDAYENSNTGKQVQQLDSQFSDACMSLALSDPNGSNANNAQNWLTALSRFSQDQQKTIFVALRLNVHGSGYIGDQEVYYASLNDWKADLQKQSAAFAARQQPAQAAASATATSTADAVASSVAAATAASVQTVQSTSSAAGSAAAVSLSRGSAPVTGASIALQVLLNVQDAEHAEKLPAAAQATKSGTSGAAGYISSGDIATPQHSLPEATSDVSSGQLRQTA